jgi:hypothetical protein
MIFDLDEWRARFILEALGDLEDKWTGIAQGTDDEDIQCDYGNDIAILQMLREQFEREAVETFGSKVKDFSRQPYKQ